MFFRVWCDEDAQDKAVLQCFITFPCFGMNVAFFCDTPDQVVSAVRVYHLMECLRCREVARAVAYGIRMYFVILGRDADWTVDTAGSVGTGPSAFFQCLANKAAGLKRLVDAQSPLHFRKDLSPYCSSLWRTVASSKCLCDEASSSDDDELSVSRRVKRRRSRAK